MASVLENSTGQEAQGSTGRRWLAPVGIGLGVAATTLALRLRDPHQAGTWGLCPLRALTGLDCPLCGGLRAVNDLTHGDLAAAWFSNALLLVSLPVLVGLWLWWLIASLTGSRSPIQIISGPVGEGPRKISRVLLWGYLALVAAFWIFRNTPWGRDYWA